MNPGLSVSLVWTRTAPPAVGPTATAVRRAPAQVQDAALAEGLIEHHCPGGRNVQRTDAARHGNAQQVVAGAADQVVQPGALASQHQNAVAGKVELIVVGRAALVQADDPQVLALQLLQRAHQVDHAGYAQMFGCAGAGLHGHRAQGRGAPLREDHTVHAGAVGHAQQCAQILRVFDAIEGQHQTAPAAGGGVGCRPSGSLEQVLDRQNSCGRAPGPPRPGGRGSGPSGSTARATPGGRGRRPRGTSATRRSRRSSWRSRATST